MSFFRKRRTKKEIPIENNKNNNELLEPEELITKLKNWIKDPSNEPETEEWYKRGYSKGISFQKIEKEQWEIDFESYNPLFLRATEYEKQQKLGEALSIYLHILNNYRLVGTSYYWKPIYLLEKKNDFGQAIEICDQAIEEIDLGHFNATTHEFYNFKEKLKRKQKSFRHH